MPTLQKRFNTLGHADVDAALPIEVGDWSDYRALKAHHYRAGHPATAMRLLAIRHTRTSPADRYLHRDPAPKAIGVLVESLPTLSCRMREVALGERYGHLRPKSRSALMNRELRCISRVIIDPRWRGLGLSVRLVRHALSTATTRYTESIAVMGHINPFCERAGMTRYERPPLPVEQRALDALRYAGVSPLALAMPESTAQQVEAFNDPARSLVIHELRRWYRAAGGRGVRQQPALVDIFTAARERLLARPIYYLHENKHVAAD